ncbi:HAMP domain-containing sensor histidine kinase [Salegentibacter sp. F188]|uniref:histidine kinase n=1 Tax=Autumnicola patrickiae TaxID=3075591 RepID=A0ABU3E5T7_9FLAO|nr:HAMP domain-containing sensor histidine kinase [Salegentibacter sp. F188]MDT0690567.1 HAMP domain-containing sensor histidine kinase [Salegentibacter sp. F188]
MNYKTFTKNKKNRSSLAEYKFVKREVDKDYDELTFLAAQICKFPIAQIGILGKKNLWFKSIYGAVLAEIPLKDSFFEEIIQNPGEVSVFLKKNAPEDFQKLEKHYQKDLEFYASIPLLSPKGEVIAIFSVLDTQARELSDSQKHSLKAIANQTLHLFEYRKQNNKLSQVQKKLKQKYHELEKFTSVVSHDIKSPLANIISLSELLKEENEGKLDAETSQYLQFLVESSYSLRNYVDGILGYYRSDHISEKDFENVDLEELLKKVSDLYQVSENIEITYPKNVTLHNVNKSALTQVFMNLVNNALKYNNKDTRRIHIEFRETGEFYFFEVNDNGNGISRENLEKIFNLFTTLDTTDRDGNPGSGIGLATVKKLVENMQGKIEVDSTPGIGSSFQFKIRRI